MGGGGGLSVIWRLHILSVSMCAHLGRTGSLPVLQPLRELQQVTRCVTGIMRWHAAGIWLEHVIKTGRAGEDSISIVQREELMGLRFQHPGPVCKQQCNQLWMI